MILCAFFLFETQLVHQAVLAPYKEKTFVASPWASLCLYGKLESYHYCISFPVNYWVLSIIALFSTFHGIFLLGFWWTPGGLFLPRALRATFNFQVHYRVPLQRVFQPFISIYSSLVCSFNLQIFLKREAILAFVCHECFYQSFCYLTDECWSTFCVCLI